LHQQVFDFNQLIIEQWYGYETRADTLFLREMLEPDERLIFTVYFDNDSTATVREPGPLQTVFTIKKF